MNSAEGSLTKTLPYLLTGLKIGIERAFPLTGLISGACQKVATLNPMIGEICLSSIDRTWKGEDHNAGW
jgi:uncharacterized membrane protein